MERTVDQYESRFTLFAAMGAGVWLIFLAPAVQQAWDERGAVVGWVGMATILVFSAVYIWSFVWGRPQRREKLLLRRLDPKAVGILAIELALAVVMGITVHQSGLGAAVYISVSAITLVPLWTAIPITVVLAATSEILARRVEGWDSAEGIALSVFLSTFAVWGIWTAMRHSRDVVAVKEENAQLAIVHERARMARDLHDILGHSLTVIAVKAELADRLVDVSPERARAEILDIQRLSRDALCDVRLTVDGVRDVTLPGELSRARAALDAAEIEAELPGSTDEVPSELRELFAWSLREGVTNVVRHSGARRCTVALGPDRVTITDDGRGIAPASGDGPEDGHGLSGLRARAAVAGAQVRVESRPGQGLQLTVIMGRNVSAGADPTISAGPVSASEAATPTAAPEATDSRLDPSAPEPTPRDPARLEPAVRPSW